MSWARWVVCRTVTPLDPLKDSNIIMAMPIDTMQGGTFADQRPWKDFIYGTTDSNGSHTKRDFFIVESVSSYDVLFDACLFPALLPNSAACPTGKLWNYYHSEKVAMNDAIGISPIDSKSLSIASDELMTHSFMILTTL